MKKITCLLFLATAILVTTQSCRKEDKKDTQVTKVISVSLRANESYSYQIPQAGDADDVMQITKQASHFLTSKVSPVGNSETLFEYKPALDFTGSDEVFISGAEGTNGGQGHSHHGNCGGKGHHETVVYDFQISITAAN